MFRRLLLSTMLASALPGCWAAALMVNQYNAYGSGYTYSGSHWQGFSTALNTAFGSSNVTVSTVAISSLSGFSAVVVDLRQGSSTLSAAEVSALQSFAAHGGRILLIGENSGWTVWNNSILAVVGGTFGGGESSATLTPSVSNSLTAGITGLVTAADGVATGGTSLFTENVVTLWTPHILSTLSVNLLDDAYGGSAGNVQFKTNLAAWLANGSATQPSVPALSNWALALLAIAMIGLVVGLSARAARVRACDTEMILQGRSN